MVWYVSPQFFFSSFISTIQSFIHSKHERAKAKAKAKAKAEDCKQQWWSTFLEAIPEALLFCRRWSKFYNWLSTFFSFQSELHSNHGPWSIGGWLQTPPSFFYLIHVLLLLSLSLSLPPSFISPTSSYWLANSPFIFIPDSEPEGILQYGCLSLGFRDFSLIIRRFLWHTTILFSHQNLLKYPRCHDGLGTFHGISDGSTRIMNQ